MPSQGGTAPPGMLNNVFKHYAPPSYLSPTAAPATEPGAVRPIVSGGNPATLPPGLQGYAQQGQTFLSALQPKALKAPQSSPLTRTTASPGLAINPQTKTPANVQAILRRLLAPPSMLPNYSN